ncbi:hypothetical protein [Pseudorhodoferax sp. Leaf265]|uniref:hypothetical protein n=1 Tax=Pseudorhodoferax sp. Leaf265 TaxID=1736315 RepID=UPI000AF171F6
MAKYLISFPSAAMRVTDAALAAADRDSHAVIEAAKAAGVYVFGGGIDAAVPPVLVAADGSVAEGGSLGAAAGRRFRRARTALARSGPRLGCPARAGLPLQPGAARVHVRPPVLTEVQAAPARNRVVAQRA